MAPVVLAGNFMPGSGLPLPHPIVLTRLCDYIFFTLSIPGKFQFCLYETNADHRQNIFLAAQASTATCISETAIQKKSSVMCKISPT